MTTFRTNDPISRSADRAKCECGARRMAAIHSPAVVNGKPWGHEFKLDVKWADQQQKKGVRF